MLKILKNKILTGAFIMTLAVFGLVLSGKNAEASACASTASGAWTTAGTWTSCGGLVPQASDTVTISAGHTVTLGSSDSINAITSLTVASTGVLTSAATISIPTVVATGTINNSGTLTIATSLTGAGSVVNTGTLNLGGVATVTTLTATATDNTVNYNGAGQTVKITPYYNLQFSGSGEKGVASALTINYDFIIDSGVTANLTGSSTAAGGLKLGGSWKSAGSYGFTGSAATNINTTYFSTGTGMVTSTLSHSSGGTTTTTTTTSNNNSSTTTTTTTTPATTPVEVVTCAQGQVFDTVTGKACTTFTTSGDVTCPTGATYDNGTGKKCTVWAQASVTTNTMEGSTTTTVTISKKVGAGSGKSEIMKLQAALNKALNIALKVDGVWGGKTTAAVKQFQAWAKLSADGKVGPMTSAALNAAI